MTPRTNLLAAATQTMAPKLLAAAAAILLAGHGLANDRDGSYSRQYGNRWAGLTVRGDAGLYTGGTFSSVNGGITDTISFFNRELEAARVWTHVWVDRSSQDAWYYFRFLGSTLRAQHSSTNIYQSLSRTLNLFPVDPTVAIPVGPFTVTISGNVGVTAYANANYFMAYPSARQVHDSSAWAFGRANVFFGLFNVVGAGVEAELQFARQRLTFDLTARPTGFAGTSAYEVAALRLKLSVYVRIIWDISTTLIDTAIAGGLRLSPFVRL